MRNSFFLIFLISLFFLNLVLPTQAATQAELLSGRILLQVESHGEAWYVDPVSRQRYYLGRPNDAFAIMRKLGLGVSNKDFGAFKDRAPKRLSGRILLKVQDRGQAYYVNPADLGLKYLGRPADAFALMRQWGLGIMDKDLAMIAISPHSAPTPEEVESLSADLQLVAQGFVSPLVLTTANDGTGRLFVADQNGEIKIIDADGTVRSEPFLDLKKKIVSLNANYDERGLLGLAFHPAYRTNGRFFVYYSIPLKKGAPTGWNHTSRIAEFKVSIADVNKADPATEKIILEINQPQANHNAGQLAFGPDGRLYIPVGDGGGANDAGTGHAVRGNAQNLETLLGKILRIDIDRASPYGVPKDNPYVYKTGRDEIFATGFRNPFRISFDAKGEHALFAGDAGQNLWEEVNLVEKGNDYGWNIREGRHCFDPANPNVSPDICVGVGANGQPPVNPIIEYKNGRQAGGLGFAVIGGYVYRGAAIPELYGRYIFGDWSRTSAQADGSLFIARKSGSDWSFKEMKIANRTNGRLGAYLLGFGQGADNEIYVLTKDNAGPSGTTGRIYRLARAGTATQNPTAQ